MAYTLGKAVSADGKKQDTGRARDPKAQDFSGKRRKRAMDHRTR
jgi:hypothetical protein